MPSLIIIGTGSEVSLAVGVAKKLAEESISVRVISMPCTELYDAQSIDYKLSQFPDGVPVMSVEAGGTRGWAQYAHAPFGIVGQFGLSAPAGDIYTHFGFTEANLTARAKDVLAFYATRPVPSLYTRPR